MLGARELLAVWERGSAQDPVRRALTMLVAVRGGTARAAAELDVGSRDVLLARLLLAIAGGTIPACADCPGCGTRLDVPVDVAAVAALPVLEPGIRLTARAGDRKVTFRLPTTADLLALRGCSHRQARAALLRRCLTAEADPAAVATEEADPAAVAATETDPAAVAATETDLATVAVTEADPAAVAAAEEAMERAAPAGAVDLLVCCPDCGRTAALPLDVPALLWAEIQARAAVVLRDVHQLAAGYGWSEADILALSPSRRAAYLALVGR